MGKASSSKKVARAARVGGSSGPKQRKLGFPVAIVAIVVLGVALIAFARADYTSAAATAPIANQDHWHTAYGVYVCDAFQAPLVDAGEDTTGIHTHGDGIIHIHPFRASAAGKNATLSKWGEVVNIDFGSNSITLPDGTELKSGYDCGGNTDTTLGVWVWPIDDPSAEPTVHTENFGGIKLDANEQALTIAVVPTGTTPPRPESEPDVARLDPTTDEIIPDATEIAPSGSEATTGESIVVDPDAQDPNLSADPNAAADPNASTTIAP